MQCWFPPLLLNLFISRIIGTWVWTCGCDFVAIFITLTMMSAINCSKRLFGSPSLNLHHNWWIWSFFALIDYISVVHVNKTLLCSLDFSFLLFSNIAVVSIVSLLFEVYEPLCAVCLAISNQVDFKVRCLLTVLRNHYNLLTHETSIWFCDTSQLPIFKVFPAHQGD